jgi:hypothetical protein
MFGSSILEVGAGLALIYLLLSLVCSATAELIESFLKKRAADLERGIRELLADKNADGYVAKLYNHPLIYSLYLGEYGSGKTRDLPSYIPARSFALALMDVVAPAKPSTLSGAAGATADAPAEAQAAPGGAAASPAISFDSLRGSIAEMPDNKLRGALLTLVDAAGDDVAKARENIENWYNGTMDRVSGWYKRRTQRILFGLGLALAVVLNVNTLRVADGLATSSTMRNALVAQAQGIANKPNLTQAEINENLNNIRNVGLPIGWSQPKVASETGGFSLWRNFFSPLFGWLITAGAVSLGAPFWFDVLNKIIVIRSTVKPHEKSPEEASEDRQRPGAK